MASTLSYLVKAAIGGGPAFIAEDQIDTESYALTQVALPAGADTTVVLGAGAATEVRMLCIAVDAYADAGGVLGITMDNADAALATPITLDGPLVLIGAGAVGLLNTPIDNLTFTNDTGADRTVTILTARNA